MSDATTTLTQASFAEEIAAADKPVVVDFWAQWCQPCLKLAPILDEIATEHADKVTIAKVNIDDNPDLARRFDIMQIPTMIVFKDGEAVQRISGAKGKAAMLEDLSDYL